MQKQNIWSYALRINKISGKEAFNTQQKICIKMKNIIWHWKGDCCRISFKHNVTLGLWQKDLTLIINARVGLFGLCFTMHNAVKSLHIFFSVSWFHCVYLSKIICTFFTVGWICVVFTLSSGNKSHIISAEQAMVEAVTSHLH